MKELTKKKRLNNFESWFTELDKDQQLIEMAKLRNIITSENPRKHISRNMKKFLSRIDDSEEIREFASCLLNRSRVIRSLLFYKELKNKAERSKGWGLGLVMA